MPQRHLNTHSRYAAKLLFQYRVGKPASSKFRLCEERIILLRNKDPASALREAKKIGKDSQSDFINDSGEHVFIEFVGVLDLMELGVEAAPNEVWYEIKTMLRPLERRNALIPEEGRLSALREYEKRG